MRSRPENWAAVFAAPHTTEYRFLIDGVEYRETDIQGTPVIEKPLMQEPCIGRCCTGSLTLAVRPHAGETIPKAACVQAFCRLKSRSGSSVTAWVMQGKYWISRRSTSGNLVTLTCRDGMMLAGRTYLDKTQYIAWPVSMTEVFNEIVSLMGVTVDSRTVIKTGADYVIAYPNEDALMSEILSTIAAAHGGSFVMTEEGALRLVPYPDTVSPVQALGTSYMQYTPLSTGEKSISRITLTDSADNQFSYGDDSGIELAAGCESATQEMAERIGAGYSIKNGVLFVPNGTLANGLLALLDESTLQNGSVVLASQSGLIGRGFIPYELSGAYLDPLMELGDTFSITRKGETVNLIAASISIRCNPSFVCDLRNGVADDDEDEVPYVSAAELQAKRYVSTGKSYYGNRINRKEGFVSELLNDGAAVARLIANATTFSMQRYHEGAWQDCIYFDAVEQKYRLTGDVTVEGAITSVDLATSGKTVINGDNITTGTLNAQLVKISGSQEFYWNNDNIYLIDPTSDQRQIRIGAFDGTNLGIGFTKDGGKSWSTALDFDGLHIDQQNEYSGVTLTATSIAFPAASDGAVMGEKTFTSNVAAYTGKTAVAPTVASVTGAPEGMTVTIGAALESKEVPLTIVVADGATLGGTDSLDGVLSVNVTSPVAMTLSINWCKVNTGAKGADGTPGKDGADGKDGTDGANGYNQAIITLYQRSAETPELPTTATTYTFATGELTGDTGGWSRTVPDGENACYTTIAAAISKEAAIIIPASAWIATAKLVENGTDGTDGKDGTDGTNGYNSAVVYLYKRAETAPDVPASALLYTFATASLTGTLDGWTQALPDADGSPCWIIQTQAIARTATVSISAWTTPVKLVEDGEAGAKTYYQDAPPTDAKEQDLWIDTDDNCKLYRYDGTEWQSVQDMNIPQILEQLVSVNTTFTVLQDSIKSKASETYVTSQYDSLIKTFNSTLEQTAQALQAEFNATAQDAAGSVDTKYSTLIRASGDGVEIGKSNSAFRTLLTNERLSFMQYSGTVATEVAYISNKKLYITDAQITNGLAIGAQGKNTFVWTKTSNGLSLRYVSAES